MHCLTIIIALLVFGECRVLVQGKSTRNNSVHQGFFFRLYFELISAEIFFNTLPVLNVDPI